MTSNLNFAFLACSSPEDSSFIASQSHERPVSSQSSRGHSGGLNISSSVSNHNNHNHNNNSSGFYNSHSQSHSHKVNGADGSESGYYNSGSTMISTPHDVEAHSPFPNMTNSSTSARHINLSSTNSPAMSNNVYDHVTSLSSRTAESYSAGMSSAVRNLASMPQSAHTIYNNKYNNVNENNNNNNNNANNNNINNANNNNNVRPGPFGMNHNVYSEVPASIRIDRREVPHDIFSAHFLDVLREDNAELEVTFNNRICIQKVASIFSSTRQEGLQEVLKNISQLLVQSALEAHEKKIELDEPQRGVSVVLPLDVVREELCNSHGFPYRYSSPTMQKAQKAFAGIDYCSSLFHRILVPRADVRSNMLMGMPIDVVLTEEEALEWRPNAPRSRPIQVEPIITTAAGPSDLRKGGYESETSSAERKTIFDPNSEELESSGRPMEAATLDKTLEQLRGHHKSFFSQLTEVSLKEQETALRVLQGMFLCYNHQRKCAVEGTLIPYATEILQCYLQHVTALHNASGQQKRKENELKEATAALTSPDKGDALHNLDNVFSVFTSGTVPSMEAGEEDAAESTRAVVVPEEGITNIVLATIDALEALCHYNPPALTRLAQSGGVRALLDVLYPSYMPPSVRVAVLDTMSLLLQEVAPFRRMGVQESPLYFGGGQGNNNNNNNPNHNHNNAVGDVYAQLNHSIKQLSTTTYDCGAGAEDALLSVMIQQAVTGAYGTEGTPPYAMDRASASKFDSAAREWFSRKGLSHLVVTIIQLRNTKLISSLDQSTAEMARGRQRVEQLWEKRVKDLLTAIDEKAKGIRKPNSPNL